VFHSLVQITVGDGRHTYFWRDRWIDGRHAIDIAPALAGKIKTRAYNSRTVAHAMENNRWISDVKEPLSEVEARDCVRLWLAARDVGREETVEDQFCWPWSSSGEYTARSTYKMLTQGNTAHPLGMAIWRNKATPKSKQFVWLAAQDRIWSADRRHRHGLQAQATLCEVCMQEIEISEHILMQCMVTREVWHICREILKLTFEKPSRESTFEDWWLTEHGRIRDKKQKKEFDALVCTVSYAIWKNRNAWVFGDARRQHRPITLAALVAEEYNLLKRSQGRGDDVGVGATIVGE
jgi:hypothetical protein